MRKTILTVLALVLLVQASACAVRARVAVHVPTPPRVQIDVEAPPPPAPPAAPAPPPAPVVQASAPEIGVGVVILTPNCTPGVPERLNGIDDNCNGQVDEGFVQSGAVQVTLGWSTGADIDLYVTDPFGEELSYRNTSVGSGGTLDRDARGACTNGQTTENVYWPAGAAPRGTYRIAAHYFNDCQAGGATEVVLSIMVGGRALGVYQYNLGPGQRIDLATFTIP
jgi:hypothetical protein